MKTPAWLKIALREKRVCEETGEKHNPRILEYQAVTTLHAMTDEVPWCAAFVCWALEKAGVPSTKSSAARSFLKFGVSIEDPVPGCIVVISRGANQDQGHVGFFLSEDDEHVFIYGGNQSDMVCVDAFSKDRVLDYRMPDEKYWDKNGIS